VLGIKIRPWGLALIGVGYAGLAFILWIDWLHYKETISENQALVAILFALAALLAAGFLIKGDPEPEWSTLGAHRGFAASSEEVYPGQVGPAMKATRLGREVILFQHTVGKITYGGVAVPLPGLAPDLRLRLFPKRLPWRLVPWRPRDAVEIGDPALDKRYDLRSNQPAVARAVLQDPLLRWALAQYPHLEEARVEGGRVIWRDATGFMEWEHMEAALPMVDRLVDAVERAAVRDPAAGGGVTGRTSA